MPIYLISITLAFEIAIIKHSRLPTCTQRVPIFNCYSIVTGQKPLDKKCHKITRKLHLVSTDILYREVYVPVLVSAILRILAVFYLLSYYAETK